jgi:hypothetical protein
MSNVHNAMGRGRLSQALRSAIGQQNAEGGIERYGETLTPTIDLWQLPEWAILRNEILFSLHMPINATVGEFSMGGISCPLAVGAQQYLIFVDEIWAATGNAAGSFDLALQLRSALAATLTLQQPVARDMRAGPNTLGANVPAPEGWTGSDPAAFVNVVDRNVNPTVFGMVPLVSAPWILKPGAALVVQNGTANQTLRVTFKGRARSALAGELVSV